MSLDTCINNVGEYYSSHYLSTTFSKDVKNLVGEWRQQGSNAIPRRIQQLPALVHLLFFGMRSSSPFHAHPFSTAAEDPPGPQLVNTPC